MNKLLLFLFQTPLLFTQIVTLATISWTLFNARHWIKNKRYGLLSIGCLSVMFLLWLSMIHTRAFICKEASVSKFGSPLYAGMHVCSTEKLHIPADTPVLICAQEQDWCKIIVDGIDGWVPSSALIIEH